MADAGKCSIQKLANDNYAIWKFEMEMALETMDLWFVVEDDVPDPVTAVWKKADRKARAHIALSIDRSQYPLIKNCATAKDVWDALKAHHEKQTVETQLSLLCRLCDAKMDESGDVEKHLLAMDALFQRVEDAGFELAEKLRIAMILRSMPKSYHFLASALQVRKDSEITMSLVKSVLTNEYMMRVGRGDSGLGGAQHQLEEQGLAVQNSVRKCYFCKKPGHLKADCRKYQQWKAQNEDGEASGSKTTQSGARAKQVKDSNDDAVSFSARVAGNEVCAGVKLGRFWTVDSGASCHMTGRKKFFTSLENSSAVVMMADGNCSKSGGIGKGKVIGVNGAGGPKEINLSNVLYVPKLENGLLSVGKITEKGFKVIFTRNSVEITNEANEVVALGEKSGGVYVLKESKQVAALAEERCHTLNCQHTWHRRLGHREVAVLDILKNEDLVSGVKVVDCGTKKVCEECLEGKSDRLPVPQLSVKKTTQPLQLVHTDLCGPMRNVTPGGNRYFMSIVDDYSKFSKLYLLKDKAEAKECVKNYVRMAENQFGRKPAIIRSDRGGEFVIKELAQFYREEEIEAQRTVGYSPQQKGSAERWNRCINDMAVCMLLDSGLDKRYWGEAIATAAYIQNRTPSQAAGKTPYELWYGQKPDLSHFRIFGCEAFVHIPGEKRGKLEAKAEKLTFVGYDCRAKAYRFLNKKKGKIIISRDARFLEVGAVLQEEPRQTATHEEKQLMTGAGDESPVAGEDETRSVDEEPPFEGFHDVSLYEGEDPDQPVPRRTQRSNAGQLPRRMDDYVVGVAKVNEMDRQKKIEHHRWQVEDTLEPATVYEEELGLQRKF